MNTFFYLFMRVTHLVSVLCVRDQGTMLRKGCDHHIVPYKRGEKKGGIF